MFPWSKNALKLEVHRNISKLCSSQKTYIFFTNSMLFGETEFIVRITGSVIALCGKSKEILMLNQAVHMVTAVLETVKIIPGCRSPVYKKRLSLYRPRRPLGLREVEAPTFSDIRLTDGGKVVSPKRRRLLTPPPGRFLVLISV
jgi:hypothetical protein